MDDTRDWVSRLLEMIPVKGTLDYRCFLGAPWRIDFPASELGEIPITRYSAARPSCRC
jgi:AraC family transcriptional activator of mtrCDE